MMCVIKYYMCVACPWGNSTTYVCACITCSVIIQCGYDRSDSTGVLLLVVSGESGTVTSVVHTKPSKLSSMLTSPVKCTIARVVAIHNTVMYVPPLTRLVLL